MKVNKKYVCRVYPSGRFKVVFLQQGINPLHDTEDLVVDATIPGTSPSPKPLIDQAEDAARTYVEMDKDRRVKEERDQAGVMSFTIPA